MSDDVRPRCSKWSLHQWHPHTDSTFLCRCGVVDALFWFSRCMMSHSTWSQGNPLQCESRCVAVRRIAQALSFCSQPSRDAAMPGPCDRHPPHTALREPHRSIAQYLTKCSNPVRDFYGYGIPHPGFDRVRDPWRTPSHPRLWTWMMFPPEPPHENHGPNGPKRTPD